MSLKLQQTCDACHGHDCDVSCCCNLVGFQVTVDRGDVCQIYTCDCCPLTCCLPILDAGICWLTPPACLVHSGTLTYRVRLGSKTGAIVFDGDPALHLCGGTPLTLSRCDLFNNGGIAMVPCSVGTCVTEVWLQALDNGVVIAQCVLCPDICDAPCDCGGSSSGSSGSGSGGSGGSSSGSSSGSGPGSGGSSGSGSGGSSGSSSGSSGGSSGGGGGSGSSGSSSGGSSS